MRGLQRQFILDAMGQRNLVWEAVEACFQALKRNAKPLLQIAPGASGYAEDIVKEAMVKSKKTPRLEFFAPERDKRVGKQLVVSGESGTGIAWELEDGSYAMKDDEEVLWRWCEGCGPWLVPKPASTAPPDLPKKDEVLLPKVPLTQRRSSSTTPASLSTSSSSTPRPRRMVSKESTGRVPVNDSEETKLPPVAKKQTSSPQGSKVGVNLKPIDYSAGAEEMTSVSSDAAPAKKDKVVRRKTSNLVPRSTL